MQQPFPQELRDIKLIGVKPDDYVSLLHELIRLFNHPDVAVFPLREDVNSALPHPLQSDTEKTAVFKDGCVGDVLLEWSPDVSLSWFPFYV